MLTPWCQWDLRSSGMLRSVEWYVATDVSGQPIVPAFKTNRLSRNVGNYHSDLRKIPDKRRSQPHSVHEDRNSDFLLAFCLGGTHPRHLSLPPVITWIPVSLGSWLVIRVNRENVFNIGVCVGEATACLPLVFGLFWLGTSLLTCSTISRSPLSQFLTFTTHKWSSSKTDFLYWRINFILVWVCTGFE